MMLSKISTLVICVAGLLSLTAPAQAKAQSRGHNIIPRPVSLEYTSGYLSVNGVSPESVAQVTFAEMRPEAYRLEVTSDGIRIEAADSAGLFYAMQTLAQLQDDKGRVPCVKIEDYPRFGWRGYMQDVSRHFFGVDFLKKQIDAMARLKLNRLHLHLTDAAGWRVEIDAYPGLTSFAAWREGALWKDWWFGSRKYLHEGTPGAYGGYFTKEELREIVSYAAARHITVVPEIEMPSHSEEVLSAYPHLSCSGEPYRHSDFCIGKEETFEFVEKVLLEVMEIFPSKYIHVGGDEASKKDWKECPRCLQRMQDEGLSDVDELQSYMIRRVGAFLESHGRTLVGWDEILQGGADSAAVVMAWRSVDEGIKSAEQGHYTVMTPGGYCYFDTYQDAPETLPSAMGGYLPLSKVYSFNPVPEGLSPEAASKVLGVQANLWAEYVPKDDHAELMIYPRLYAISEIAWSPEEGKDYRDFHRRALKLCDRMQAEGYNVFPLAQEYGNRPASLKPVKHKAVGCKVTYNAPYYPGYVAGGDSALVDGLHGGWTYSDGLWQGFITRKRLDVVVDLGKVQNLKSVQMDFMQVCGPEVFLPAEVVISVSSDGENFTELWRQNREIVRDDKVTFVTDGWHGKSKGRYVKVEARSGKYGGFIFTDEIVIR